MGPWTIRALRHARRRGSARWRSRVLHGDEWRTRSRDNRLSVAGCELPLTTFCVTITGEQLAVAGGLGGSMSDLAQDLGNGWRGRSLECSGHEDHPPTGLTGIRRRTRRRWVAGSKDVSLRGPSPAEYCGAPCWSLEGMPPWPTLTVVLRSWSRTRTLP